MQITALSLDTTLKKEVPQCSLLFGNESLLIEESKRLLTQHLKTKGITETEIFILDHASKTLLPVLEEVETPSLFCQSKLIYCHIQNTLKPEDRKTLQTLLEKMPPDYYFMLRLEKVTPAQQKEPWFLHFLNQGLVISHWPLTRPHYLTWLTQRARQFKLNIQPEAITLLADLTEGNILAGANELEKLTLLDLSSVSTQDILDLISQQSRYNVHDLYQAVLDNQSSLVCQIFEYLKKSHHPLPLLVWSLHQLLQAFFTHAFPNAGLTAFPVLPKQHTFQALLSKKRDQLTQTHVAQLTTQLAKIDTYVKTYQTEISWRESLEFCLFLCKVPF